MDYQEDEDASQVISGDEEDEGPSYPVVDSEVQNELMSMNPFERLEAIDQLMEQAAGEALPDGEDVEGACGEDRMDAHGSSWFECDLQNLRILKAITLESTGKPEDALRIWEQCIEFTDIKMPPNDENSIVMRVQAALCCMNLNHESRAQQHAAIAIQKHNLMFGGGVRRFRRRYRQEFRLNLRPNSSNATDQSFEEILWPYE